MYIDFLDKDQGMSANKRTFEVDRFLTRELLLRNADNSYPSVNQAIFTDGNGGTYLAPINPTIPTTGFNQFTLFDTQETFVANKPYNNLNIKQGLGVIISKQNIDSQDYLTFQVTALVPSSFNQVTTSSGSVIATGFSSNLNIISYDGVNVSASSNSLLIGGTPAFGIINLSSASGFYSLIPSTSLSSVTIQAGFGITLAKTGNTSYSIANTISSYALNAIIVRGQSSTNTLNFLESNNTITLSTAGITQLNVTSTTITIANYAFSNVNFPGSLRLEASTQSNTLNFSPGYGLTYSTLNNNSSIQINTSLPSSFSFISTSRGVISAYNSTNILTLSTGYGIDYAINDQTLQIKLASTFVSQISTETGVVTATNNSIMNLRQGKSIVYSTSSDNALYINSKDYNRIDIVDGSSGLITTSLFATLNLKTFQLVPGPGLTIVGNTNNNRITITPISSVLVSSPQYAFSFVQVYSTASFLGENLSLFQNTQTINSAPNASAIVGISPVFPLQMQADTNNNIIYMGMDVSSLLFSTNTFISTASNIFLAYNMNASALRLNTSSINTSTLNATAITVSSLSVGNSVVIGSTSTLSSLVIASQISSLYIESQVLCPSTIGNLQISSPLMTFNYISTKVGINVSSPQATLHVGGTILAQNFATYSDSSLKSFKTQFSITQDDLETLKPWNFTWKSNEVDDVGFAAEDVEKVFPSAVKTGENGLKMVDYGRLSIVSLAALRDTQKRLNSLESTMCSLLERM